ncbi:hypothetical protein VTO42DRAFT_7614 [Malbranchea cinnamomea]
MGERGLGRLRDHFRGRSSGSSSPDDTYLTYHDIRLTNEDVYTLRYDWLTDNVIAFWEEYLEREYLVHYKTSHIVLLRPSMSFLLSQTPDPLTLRDALPSFSTTSHIFLPVNDCRDVNEAEGGSHWSLLLVSVVDGIAFHYDSLSPGNKTEALILREKLRVLLNKPLRFLHLEDTPQQDNGSDCGVFVCMFMRYLLLKRLLMVSSSQRVNMSLGNVKMDAEEGRKEIFHAIERFKGKGNKNSS